MTLRLGWVEEVLQWVSTETNTMAIKLKDMHKPENYRGDVVKSLIIQKKHFFEDLENLQVKLEGVAELASELVAITDLCSPDEPEEES